MGDWIHLNGDKGKRIATGRCTNKLLGIEHKKPGILKKKKKVLFRTGRK
jgi:hypothetical protein